MTKNRHLGIWLIGAKGGVASTAIAGLLAMQRGLTPEVGLISGVRPFVDLPWVPWNDMVVGGHEIRSLPLAAAVAELVDQSRTLDRRVFEAIVGPLEDIDREIRPGTIFNGNPTVRKLASLGLPDEETPAQAIERLAGDLNRFAQQHDLRHLVVVNVASTEPPIDANLPSRWTDLQRLLEDPRCPLPASALYAIAAFMVGASYINFTPSLGACLPALDELCLQQGSRHYGRDGKTGETLMKSVLAPMFARRNLEVLSWVGHNIFGNMDGIVLADPANKQSKIASKDHLIGDILGYKPQTHVSIEYIASLGDWKTAWDHIHFRGFLGVPMTLQFIWQGCDSVLAAPLVLDLARLADLAQRCGQRGQMCFMAPYFKSPLGVREQSFDQQFRLLEQWASEVASSLAPADSR